MSLPGNHLGKNYSIVEEPDFLDKIYELVGHRHIWDEAKSAFDRLLSRDPEAVGDVVWGGAWRTIDLLTKDGKVWVLYWVDHAHKRVILVDALRG